MIEIRGVWIANRPHSKVLESLSNIAEAMDFLQAHGFNLIFPVMWNRGYTLYPSQIMSKYSLPPIDPYYDRQQRDPLQEIINEAHQRQIKVIPWLEYGFAASHLLDGGHILQQYPHWQAIDHDGAKTRHGSLTWMNAFHPEVQQFMLDIITEIVSLYDVDGIQGCDRLPASPVTTGYDPETIRQYQAEFDQLPPQNHHEQQWFEWRAARLTDFLARMYQGVKAIRPEAIVSLSPAVYPFCLNNLLQNFPVWIDRGLCDLVHPQIYRPNFFGYNREVKQLTKTFERRYLDKFAPGIAFTANGKEVSLKDLIKCIKANRDRDLSGQVFFHYEGLRKNDNAVAIALFKAANYNQVATLPEVLS